MFESPNKELIPKRFHQFIHQNMEWNSRTEIGWAVISSRAFVPVQITSELWLQRQRRVVEKLCMSVWWMFPADTRRWLNVGYTLVQRRRRWTNVKPTFIQRLVSAGFVRRNPCCQQGLIQYFWVTFVKSTLKRCNLLHYWEKQAVPDEIHLLKLLKKNLESQYKTSFNEILNKDTGSSGNGGNKLRTYAKIKNNYVMEPYMQYNFPPSI